ncbi:MAG: hypothetical protein ACRCWC_11710, partial [Plesiomonas shigelloides]
LTTQLSELADTLQLSESQEKLLRWATLHIQNQDEALEELREQFETEMNERLRLEDAMYKAQQSIETALQAVRYGQCSSIEFSRDMSGHINIMAAHGDEDYLTKDGQSIRHIDLRQKKPRKKKEKTASD